MSVWERLRGFHNFSLNRECVPSNHGLVDQQYKSKKFYSKSFNVNGHFPLKMWNFSTCVFILILLINKAIDYNRHFNSSSETCSWVRNHENRESFPVEIFTIYGNICGDFNMAHCWIAICNIQAQFSIIL